MVSQFVLRRAPGCCDCAARLSGDLFFVHTCVLTPFVQLSACLLGKVQQQAFPFCTSVCSPHFCHAFSAPRTCSSRSCIRLPKPIFRQFSHLVTELCRSDDFLQTRNNFVRRYAPSPAPCHAAAWKRTRSVGPSPSLILILSSATVR